MSSLRSTRLSDRHQIISPNRDACHDAVVLNKIHALVIWALAGVRSPDGFEVAFAGNVGGGFLGGAERQVGYDAGVAVAGRGNGAGTAAASCAGSKQLLDHYTTTGVPTLLWDKDRQLPARAFSAAYESIARLGAFPGAAVT